VQGQGQAELELGVRECWEGFLTTLRLHCSRTFCTAQEFPLPPQNCFKLDVYRTLPYSSRTPKKYLLDFTFPAPQEYLFVPSPHQPCMVFDPV